MLNLVALSLIVSDKKDIRSFQKILSFVAMATRNFKGIKYFQEILKRNMAETFL